ncbi:uncharacterized protein LOC143205177 [Rhynchophorus ferrugineus]|uniref:uncharacterized protein LOC143205177 n=1 Tax=Rhynchophorus ferrugineus TaxID=354439 RepID=UPI003FCC685E
MKSERQINDIEQLLKSQLEEDEKIADVEVSRLTAPGENYGSIMLRILVTLENTKTSKKRTLDAVGKIIPESERVREAFSTQTTFTLEYNFYAVVSSVLDQFLKRNNVKSGADFLAPFVGGRLNLNEGPIVDNDAIIVLRNLRVSGYSTGEKTTGLDPDHSKVVLDTLAKFHATVLGLKIKEPEKFDKYIRPCFFRYYVDKDLHTVVKTNLSHYLKLNGFTDEEVKKADNTFVDFHQNEVNDVWGTLIHYDSWTNNLLIKKENDKPTHCVLVDFQVPDYGTPLDDISFFLFTSVQNLFDGSTFDDLLDYYYDKLLKNLRNIGVETTVFTKDSFDEEVGKAIKNYQYYHTMWMLHPLMYEHMKSIDDLDKNDAEDIVEWSKKHIKRIVDVTKLCLERNYI